MSIRIKIRIITGIKIKIRTKIRRRRTRTRTGIDKEVEVEAEGNQKRFLGFAAFSMTLLTSCHRFYNGVVHRCEHEKTHHVDRINNIQYLVLRSAATLTS